MQEMILGKLRYIIKYPKGFECNNKYPVLIFLHGAGTRGNDIEVLKDNPYFSLTEACISKIHCTTKICMPMTVKISII